ncbi:transcriptional repressor [Primorskyibacter aestuariivivens]|uniref:Fur family transcriptional regulator n=1 Tax=Primorskyibacter aestuariivivens TaxID=1888912 RepID=UPI002300E8BD|nr:transcriptional repressor [Primorskyibacter aestuariivivens]MDA7428213.1 transcriptional repressor [Primorskyibacter aestuariivivens]
MQTIGFAKHDHSHCRSEGIAAADAYCAAHGLQFTPVRRRVLEILLTEHRAMGAYDLLETLGEEGFGSQPPVAYRALEFLVKHGFAHKIERLNAFVGCAHPGADHSPVFLICRGCKAVAEVQARPGEIVLNDLASAAGFRVERAVVEAEGLCPKCQAGAEE